MKIILAAILMSMSVSASAQFIETKKGPVYFPHSLHSTSIRCLGCHKIHGGLVIPLTTHEYCQSCHDPKVIQDKCKFCHVKK